MSKFFKIFEFAEYKGDKQKGMPHGVGVLYINSWTFRGNFIDGSPEGFGVITNLQDDQMICGGFLPSFQLTGFGLIKDSKHDYSYRGNFVDGAKTGICIETTPEGRYVGQIRRGIYTGRGSFSDKLQNIVKCHWENGHKNGFGIELKNNGDAYSGWFLQDLYSKCGNYKEVATNLEYFGEFMRGKKHGFGRVENSSYLYAGEWNADRYEGLGYYVEKSEKNYYFGQWSRGRQHGIGHANNKSMEFAGEWHRGYPHGKGFLTKQGVRRPVLFQKGELKTFLEDDDVLAIKQKLEEELNLSGFLHSAKMALKKIESLIVDQQKRAELSFEDIESRAQISEKNLGESNKILDQQIENLRSSRQRDTSKITLSSRQDSALRSISNQALNPDGHREDNVKVMMREVDYLFEKLDKPALSVNPLSQEASLLNVPSQGFNLRPQNLSMDTSSFDEKNFDRIIGLNSLPVSNPTIIIDRIPAKKKLKALMKERVLVERKLMKVLGQGEVITRRQETSFMRNASNYERRIKDLEDELEAMRSKRAVQVREIRRTTNQVDVAKHKIDEFLTLQNDSADSETQLNLQIYKYFTELVKSEDKISKYLSREANYTYTEIREIMEEIEQERKKKIQRLDELEESYQVIDNQILQLKIKHPLISKTDNYKGANHLWEGGRQVQEVASPEDDVSLPVQISRVNLELLKLGKITSHRVNTLGKLQILESKFERQFGQLAKQDREELVQISKRKKEEDELRRQIEQQEEDKYQDIKIKLQQEQAQLVEEEEQFGKVEQELREHQQKNSLFTLDDVPEQDSNIMPTIKINNLEDKKPEPPINNQDEDETLTEKKAQLRKSIGFGEKDSILNETSKFLDTAAKDIISFQKEESQENSDRQFANLLDQSESVNHMVQTILDQNNNDSKAKSKTPSPASLSQPNYLAPLTTSSASNQRRVSKVRNMLSVFGGGHRRQSMRPELAQRLQINIGETHYFSSNDTEINSRIFYLNSLIEKVFYEEKVSNQNFVKINKNTDDLDRRIGLLETTRQRAYKDITNYLISHQNILFTSKLKEKEVRKRKTLLKGISDYSRYYDELAMMLSSQGKVLLGVDHEEGPDKEMAELMANELIKNKHLHTDRQRRKSFSVFGEKKEVEVKLDAPRAEELSDLFKAKFFTNPAMSALELGLGKEFIFRIAPLGNVIYGFGNNKVVLVDISKITPEIFFVQNFKAPGQVALGLDCSVISHISESNCLNIYDPFLTFLNEVRGDSSLPHTKLALQQNGPDVDQCVHWQATQGSLKTAHGRFFEWRSEESNFWGEPSKSNYLNLLSIVLSKNHAKMFFVALKAISPEDVSNLNKSVLIENDHTQVVFGFKLKETSNTVIKVPPFHLVSNESRPCALANYSQSSIILGTGAKGRAVLHAISFDEGMNRLAQFQLTGQLRRVSALSRIAGTDILLAGCQRAVAIVRYQLAFQEFEQIKVVTLQVDREIKYLQFYHNTIYFQEQGSSCLGRASYVGSFEMYDLLINEHPGDKEVLAKNKNLLRSLRLQSNNNPDLSSKKDGKSNKKRDVSSIFRKTPSYSQIFDLKDGQLLNGLLKFDIQVGPTAGPGNYWSLQEGRVEGNIILLTSDGPYSLKYEEKETPDSEQVLQQPVMGVVISGKTMATQHIKSNSDRVLQIYENETMVTSFPGEAPPKKYDSGIWKMIILKQRKELVWIPIKGDQIEIVNLESGATSRIMLGQSEGQGANLEVRGISTILNQMVIILFCFQRGQELLVLVDLSTRAVVGSKHYFENKLCGGLYWVSDEVDFLYFIEYQGKLSSVRVENSGSSLQFQESAELQLSDVDHDSLNFSPPICRKRSSLESFVLFSQQDRIFVVQHFKTRNQMKLFCMVELGDDYAVSSLLQWGYRFMMISQDRDRIYSYRLK